MTPFAFVLVFSGFLLLHAASGTLEENCKKIAGQTVTYEFCMASLGADPNSKNADLPTLGVISSKLTLAKGTAVQAYIAKLLHDKASDTKLVKALKDCKSNYADILPDGVEAAIKGFESRQYNDANIHLSAIMDSPDDCESGIKEIGAAAPPELTKLNEDFKNLAAIALHISAILLGLRH